MQIGVLGPLEVTADTGTPVAVGGARLRRLLILLALEPGRIVDTGRLIDGLWADAPPAGAANALQALVSRLRRAIPGLPVESHPVGYRLAVDATAVDVHRFEHLVRTGRDLLASDPPGAATVLADALRLWRGPALADVADADFARAPAARLDELRLTATEQRVEARLAAGEAAALVPELQALVTAHPLRERFAGQLIRALRDTGRAAEALTAYARLRGTLADTLGTEPSAELATLHLTLLRDTAPPPHPTASDSNGGPVPARSSTAAPEPTHNLPTPLTSFVGRAPEIRRVGALLTDARLVTLTGPGGAGKTRLAIESARTLLGQVPDGGWLVELAPVTDGAEVPQTVLQVLGLREPGLLATARNRAAIPEPSPVDRLAAAIGTRRMLLLLDNCEHLVDAAARLADRLLATCPRLRVLATSREPLGITGETLCPVDSLPLPPPDADPEIALTYPAVGLLADRARAVRPDFTVNTGNVAPVVQICRSLDGMPLAIELAAARLRSMTPAQVADRLDDRFRLLTGGSRTALPRHQTLRAVFDWSWELLDDAERALWRRLAVFSGGATLDTVERVCAADGLTPAVRPEDVLDRLAALVDKSLVVVGGDGEPRYRMLETIREYGLRRLAEAGEAEAVRRSHATDFLAVARRADQGLRRADQLRWLGWLDAEHDNLHAALRWAIGARDAGLSVGLVAALGWYWWTRGLRIEAVELARPALALPDVERVPPEQLGVAQLMAAMNLLSTGEFTESVHWLASAARTAAGHEADEPMLRLIGPVSVVFHVDKAATAVDVLVDGFADPDPWVRAVNRMFRAHHELNFGRSLEVAEADTRAALDGFRSIGERWGTAYTLAALGDLASRRGEPARAAALRGEALELMRVVGAAEDLPVMQAGLAHDRWRLGDRDQAYALLADADRQAGRISDNECRAAVAHMYAELLRLDGDLVGAQRRLTQAGDLVSERLLAPQWRATLASSNGYLAGMLDDLPAARGHHDQALTCALEFYDAPVLATVLVGYADLALRTGRSTAAALLLGAAYALRGGADLSSLDGLRVESTAREILGEAAFAEAFTRGRNSDVTPAALPHLVRTQLD
ncbi:BTAD domain-containing putative transcriptional regulator [Plantactinospora sp. B24E8]|uniref:AfsR/SARP family transcriptional regulator n=1 Tax=Plantactinospora sp. B24E8 TaxID=3153567 RepID=UPI00325DCE62